MKTDREANSRRELTSRGAVSDSSCGTGSFSSSGEFAVEVIKSTLTGVPCSPSESVRAEYTDDVDEEEDINGGTGRLAYLDKPAMSLTK
jgi:hypothetical protein